MINSTSLNEVHYIINMSNAVPRYLPCPVPNCMSSLAERRCPWCIVLLPDGTLLRRHQHCSCNITVENFITPFVFIRPIIGLTSFGNLLNSIVYVMTFKFLVEQFAIAVGYPWVIKFQSSKLWPF
jgi:hypothetical protein